MDEALHIGATYTGTYNAYRLDIHHQLSDGIKATSNSLVQDCYLHDFTASVGSHTDGIQMQSGITNFVVRHNTFLMATDSTTANAAVYFSPESGPSTAGPVKLIDNYLAGSSYALRITDGGSGLYHITNYTIAHNRWDTTSSFGPVHIGEPYPANFTAWINNTFLVGGADVYFNADVGVDPGNG
jgi:hypothetical protein